MKRLLTVSTLILLMAFVVHGDFGPGPGGGDSTITTATVTDITGILKGDGATVSAASAGSDYEAAVTKGNLTEDTSSVLTISGGTGAVIGSGTTIQLKLAGAGQSGYLSNTDWSTFNGKYVGLPTQTGHAGEYLTTNGTAESWAAPTRTGVIRTLWVDAGAMQTRTTLGAESVNTESATSKEMSDSFDFDTASDEFCQFRCSLPDEWDRGTIKAKFYWTAASGSGTTMFMLQAVALRNDDAIDTAFGTAVGVADTLITALDVHITSATAAITVGGTMSLGNIIWWQIYRDVSEDTLDVDAKLLGVMIQYTESGTEPSAW